MPNSRELADRMLSCVIMTPLADLPKEIQHRAVALVEDLLTFASTGDTSTGLPERPLPIPSSRLGGMSIGPVAVDEIQALASPHVHAAVASLANEEFAVARLVTVGVARPSQVVTIAKQLAVGSHVTAGAIVEQIAGTYARGVLTFDVMQWLTEAGVITGAELTKVLGVSSGAIAAEVVAGRVKPEELVRMLGYVAAARSDTNAAQQALAVEVHAIPAGHDRDPRQDQKPNRADRRRSKRKRG